MTRQERAVRTRNQLIAAAATTFDSLGYTQTSLSAVIARAGVSSGALYFHFENKAALAAAVMAEASHSLHTTVLRVYRNRGCALQALVDSTHVLAALLRGDVIVRAGFRLDCDGHGATRPDLRGEWHAHVQRLLGEAAIQGCLAPDLSLQVAASTIVAVTVGLEVLARDNHEWLSPGLLAGFWRLQLPQLASAKALVRQEPAGSSAVRPPDRSSRQPVP